MNYEAFISSVQAYIHSLMPPETNVIIHKVQKNNNISLDGISILREGEVISPTLYLNDFYEAFLSGTSIEDIATHIIQICQENPYGLNFNAEEFKDYSKIQNKIVYKLVNYDNNRFLLSEIPHRRFLDLAIVFYILLHIDSTENATILIRNEHLAVWNISISEIFQAANKNTPLLLPAKIQTMEEILTDYSEQAFSPYEEEFSKGIYTSSNSSAISMFILTNQIRINGAATLLYEHLLHRFSESLNQNLFLLPSSIHEIILVPANGRVTKNQLKAMVEEVNSQEVDEIDQLSNHVYFYDHNTNTISL